MSWSYQKDSTWRRVPVPLPGLGPLSGVASFLANLPLLGTGVWQTYVQIFAATDLMVLGIGIYDCWTRRRVHPAWVFGALWLVVGQLIASYLYYDATWKVIATSIVRAW